MNVVNQYQNEIKMYMFGRMRIALLEPKHLSHVN